MLIDTESFAYIFGGNTSDENNLINKVKTAMLLIQKDYENKGFTSFSRAPHAREATAVTRAAELKVYS